MSNQYEARDMDTHAVIIDRRTGAAAVRPTLAAAEAEAARLNAAAGKRSLRITVDGGIDPQSSLLSRAGRASLLTITNARVRIEEISDDE